MCTEEAERELAVRVAAGDQVALQELLHVNYMQLRDHLEQKLPTSLRQTMSVDDVLQEAFLQAFRDINQYDCQRPFWPWLKRIGENRLLDEIRALKSQKRGGDRRRARIEPYSDSSSIFDLVEQLSADSPTPSGSVAGQEAIQAVRIGIASLPNDQREAIRLRFLESMSLDETARTMNRTASSVRSLIHRAKISLREILGTASMWLSKRS